MGNHYDRVFLLQFHEEVFHGLARYGVEGTGRLVGQEIVRLYGQAAGQTQTLLLTAGEFVGGRVQTVLHLIPQAHCLQIVLHHEVKLTLAAHTVDATAVGDVVVDAHRQRTGSLRHQSDVAAQFGHLAGASGYDILLSQIYLAVDFHPLNGVYKTVEGA